MRNPNDEYDRLHDHMTAIARERDWLLVQLDKWIDIAKMMTHFDLCTSARLDCNICEQARLAYVEALPA